MCGGGEAHAHGLTHSGQTLSDMLLDLVAPAINDATPVVVTAACWTLRFFVEVVERDIQ